MGAFTASEQVGNYDLKMGDFRTFRAAVGEGPKAAKTAMVGQVHFGPRPCAVLKRIRGPARYPTVPPHFAYHVGQDGRQVLHWHSTATAMVRMFFGRA